MRRASSESESESESVLLERERVEEGAKAGRRHDGSAKERTASKRRGNDSLYPVSGGGRRGRRGGEEAGQNQDDKNSSKMEPVDGEGTA